jgi:hypothetical protein
LFMQLYKFIDQYLSCPDEKTRKRSSWIHDLISLLGAPFLQEAR